MVKKRKRLCIRIVEVYLFKFVEHNCKSDSRLQALLCGSAVGFYGNRGIEVLDEEFESEMIFLQASVEWEESTKAASDSGIRVVFLRTGIVVSPLGGALAKLLLPAKFGAGGVSWRGKQIQSWLLDDESLCNPPPNDERSQVACTIQLHLLLLIEKPLQKHLGKFF